MATVLIVEDEWAIADWLASLLDDEGHQVLVAGNGRKALELLAGRRPDLILTDFMMPVMDGPTMLRAVKADGHADIPVIVMSSLPEATVRERCEGYALFLRKPFRERDLLEAMQRLLG